MSKPILTLDVGFNNMGWAVLQNGKPLDSGVFEINKSKRKTAVRKGDADIEHCQFLTRSLSLIIKTEGIGGVIAEMPGAGARSQRAAVCMRMAGAIVAAVCELHELPNEWIMPQDGKVAATGSATASKADVIAAIGLQFPSLDEPGEHVCDALAAYMAAQNGSMVRLLNAD